MLRLQHKNTIKQSGQFVSIRAQLSYIADPEYFSLAEVQENDLKMTYMKMTESLKTTWINPLKKAKKNKKQIAEGNE